MKTLICVFLMLSAFSAQAFERTTKTRSEIHRELCRVANINYPDGFHGVENCLEQSRMRMDSQYAWIKFVSCAVESRIIVFFDLYSELTLTTTERLNSGECSARPDEPGDEAGIPAVGGN